jgi:hypothetical protein
MKTTEVSSNGGFVEKNNVEFSYADASQKTSGFSYYTKEKDFTIEPNDLIVK